MERHRQAPAVTGIDALLRAATIRDEQLLLELESIRVENDIRELEEQLSIWKPRAVSTPAPPVITSGGTHETQSIERSGDNSELATAIQSLAEACVYKGKGLPKREPEVFKGDPFDFPVWMNSFKVLVEDRYTDPTDRLYYLGRYTEGKAKEPIRGLLLLNTSQAYDKAKYILQERFGNKLQLAQGFRQKLANWPSIHTGPEIRDFSDFLNQCHGAMSTLGHLSVLNDPLEQEKIVSRLPRNVQVRWYAQVDKWQHRRMGEDDIEISARLREDEAPPFLDLCAFIEREARVLCNPLLERQGGNKARPQSQKPVNASNNNRPNSGSGTKPKVSTTFASSSGGTPGKGDKAKPSNTDASSLPKKVSPCTLCKGLHLLDVCSVFKGKSLAERYEFVKSKGLCLGCYKWGHKKFECRNKLKCAVCNAAHPTSLHNYAFVPVESNTAVTNATSHRTESIPHEIDASYAYCHSLIVPVFLRHCSKPDGNVLVYCLLDDQSDTSFVTDSTLEKLQVSGEETKLRLATVLGEDVIDCQKIDGLLMQGMRESTEIPLHSAYSRSNIPANPGQIPRSETARKWTHLEHVAGQLVPYLPDVEVGLLVGTNCARALRPLEIAAGGEDDPYGVRTALGWGVVGSMETSAGQPTASHGHFTMRTCAKEIAPSQVAQMFDLDFSEKPPFQTTDKVSQEDHRFMSIVQNSISQCEDGHFQLPLPFKTEEVRLPNNRPAALKRLKQLASKMKRNEGFKEDYVKFMTELLDNGQAERVPESELALDDGSIWYLPHHGVYNPHKPGKIRVVFDASAEYQSEVLNKHLLQGPDMTNNLSGVLLRFRKEPIALTCDIKKMFYQVRMDPASRNYLRFLWFENGNPDTPPIELRMVVTPFGTRASPSLANFALKTTAETYRSEYGDQVADFIKDDFYVDDGLKSFPTPEEATSVALSSKDLCAKGGFTLCQFLSNSEEVMSAIPENSHAKSVHPINLNRDWPSSQIERALGIVWHLESDTFRFCIELRDQPLTRRGILSTVSSIFDPLGLVSPFVLRGKKILQELCHSANWDDPVPDECRSQWEQWRGELIVLAKVEIPRCYRAQEAGKCQSAELHHFSDASSEGYGQCSYLRLTDDKGITNTSLVMAKSRVAPSKTVTIPRLELNAAVVSVKISTFLARELKYCELQNYYYTDSRVVLGYIANESKRFHVFVANRVQQIRDVTSPQQWRHVPTDCNPADLASRGMKAEEMVSSKLWWKGPNFLQTNETIPQPSPDRLALRDDDPEVKRTPHVVLRTGAAPVVHASMLERFQRFSSFFKLKRAVALCQRYVRILHSRVTRTETDQKDITSEPVTVGELSCAEQLIVRLVQEDAFREELRAMGKHSDGVAKGIGKTSPLYGLDPFIDENSGLLRVGGRIKRSKLPRSVKHPVVLPRKHHVTNLLIDDCHRKEAHGGRGVTLNSTRQAGYWILGGRSTVASFIMKCVMCRRLRGAFCGQKMADLPEDRLEAAPAFTYSGVDYFGPYLVKEGRKELKRWGVLFTCLSSRAIHLETANSLDTDAFLNAYRRFACRRGPIRVLRSDRGSNFIGGKNEIDAAWQEMDHTKITQELLKENCDWFDFKMNFPHSSHMGGVWERMIGSARTVLTSLLTQHGTQLDDELLRTLFAEVELVVNSRPLTYIDTTSPDSLEPLTPHQLLTLKSKVVMPPPGNFVREDLYCRKRWRRVQYLSNQFWTRWRKEFVPSLQTRKKWQDKCRNLAVGDVALMLDESLPRCQWPLARVLEVAPSSGDNLVRKVKAKTGKTVLERPVHKLVFLLSSAETQ